MEEQMKEKKIFQFVLFIIYLKNNFNKVITVTMYWLITVYK